MGLREHQRMMKAIREAESLERRRLSKRYGLDPRSKLTRAQIVAIKRKPANMTKKECAEIVGVEPYIVSNILYKNSHAHIIPKETETWEALQALL